MDYKYNSINELNHFDFAEASVGDIQMADNMFHMVVDNVKILPENSFNRDIRVMRTNEMLFKIEGAEYFLYLTLYFHLIFICQIFYKLLSER